VEGGLGGQRRHVQAAQGHVCAALRGSGPRCVRAPRRGDVDLNHHEIRRVVQVEPFHVLVLDLDFRVVGR
jgi:hypothetical protein